VSIRGILLRALAHRRSVPEQCKHVSPNYRRPGIPTRRIPGDICVLRPVAEGTGRSKCLIRGAAVVLRAPFCALTNRRRALGYRVAKEDLHGRP
jgi:hypothetical protein